MEWILSADNRLLTLIQEHLRTPLGDAVMPWITALGNLGIFWILLAVVLLFFPRWRMAGVQMLTAMALATLVGTVILKPLIARERPFLANDFTGLLIAAPKDFSFSSGHSAASMAAAAVLLRRSSRAGVPALILALLIAFSRMYLYVHYPSDVLAGLLLGVLSALAGMRLVNFLWSRRPGAHARDRKV